MGGLSKKAYQIEILRKKQGALLIVDSGNLLFKHPVIPQGRSQEESTANGIIKAYEQMAYDAVAVGPYDLAAGVDFLTSRDKAQMPWVSANILTKDNSPVFSPYLIKDIDRSRIGIIGLTNETSPLPSDLHLADWRTVLPPLFQSLAQKCDHIILLSNLSNTENYEIARQYPQLDIIVSADLRYRNLGPIITHNTLITQTAAQGKYIGKLDIAWGDAGGGWSTGHDRLIDAKRTAPSSFTENFIALTKFLPDSVKMQNLLAKVKQQTDNHDKTKR